MVVAKTKFHNVPKTNLVYWRKWQLPLSSSPHFSQTHIIFFTHIFFVKFYQYSENVFEYSGKLGFSDISKTVLANFFYFSTYFKNTNFYWVGNRQNEIQNVPETNLVYWQKCPGYHQTYNFCNLKKMITPSRSHQKLLTSVAISNYFVLFSWVDFGCDINLRSFKSQ